MSHKLNVSEAQRFSEFLEFALLRSVARNCEVKVVQLLHCP